jgi:probable HAF family extracellular repeat protein
MADAMNGLGSVVGYDRGFGCMTEAFLWTSETGMVGLGDLPGDPFSSAALGINDSDQVVGSSMISPTVAEAFFWSAETGMIGLFNPSLDFFPSSARDINNAGWVTGYGHASMSGQEAFIWTAQTGAFGIGGLGGASVAHAINNHGQVTGASYSSTGYQAFIWDPDDGMVGIGTYPGADSTYGIDINDRGTVIGEADVDDPPHEGWIWDSRRGMRNIFDLINPCAPARLQRNFHPPQAINNHGQLVATMYETGNPKLDVPGLLLTPYIPGDLNADAVCDITDLARLLSNFGTLIGMTYADGDLTCDGSVYLPDLAILLGNFGESLP